MAKEIEKTVSLDEVQQELIEQGKSKGVLTYKEILDSIKTYELSAEGLDNFYDKLIQHGVDIVDETKNEAGSEKNRGAELVDEDKKSMEGEDLDLPEGWL